MSYNSKYTGAEVEAAIELARNAQPKLNSGENIKTINGGSILGKGNIVIGGMTEEEVDNKISAAITTALNTEV